jgi:hypothetical protein
MRAISGCVSCSFLTCALYWSDGMSKTFRPGVIERIQFREEGQLQSENRRKNRSHTVLYSGGASIVFEPLSLGILSQCV